MKGLGHRFNLRCLSAMEPATFRGCRLVGSVDIAIVVVSNDAGSRMDRERNRVVETSDKVGLI